MNYQFMPFIESYILQQHGFKKPCLGYYDNEENFVLEYKEDYDPMEDDISCLAPFTQQVIDFYTENGINVDISNNFFYISVEDINYKSKLYDNYDYVDCEYDCCLKLIRDFSKYINPKDWYYELTDAQRESIERGMKDIEEGRFIPHEEVMKKIEQMFKKKDR